MTRVAPFPRPDSLQGLLPASSIDIGGVQCGWPFPTKAGPAGDVVAGVAGPGSGRSGWRGARWLGQAAEVGADSGRSEVGEPVHRLHQDGQAVGLAWQDPDARSCMVWGIIGAGGSPAEQAAQAFARLELVLAQEGFGLTDVIRTWCFLDRILDWYGDFNRVRNDLFRRRGVFNQVVPASTGIGCANAGGSAISLSAWARIAARPAAAALAVPSPLQCPALDYRSSFSRALEFPLPQDAGRFLTISGTASIGPDGLTIHPNDFPAQAQRTVAVLDALLRSRGFAWSDTVRAVAYVRHHRDLASWQAMRARDSRLADLAWIDVEATICRDDLLFEVELDAMQPETA